jgi:ribose transport system substrate-binding protein
MRLRRSLITAPVLVVTAALALTACSSSSKSASSSTQSAGPDGSTAASSSAATTAIAAAQQAVQAKMTRPTTIEVTQPVGAPIPKGKTIDWIQCAIPACTQLGVGLKGATDALGWKLNIIDSGLTAEGVTNAWAKAVQQKPDAVIGAGNPKSLFQASLQQLAAAGIPVVDIDVTDSAGDGITAVIQGSSAYGPSGALIADWVLADGGTKANTLVVDTSAYPVVGLRVKGFKDEYAKLCPNCPIDTIEAQVTDFGDKLDTQIVGYLQAHPKVNYVAAGVSDMVTGLSSALQGAGLGSKVKVISNDINPALEQDLRSGGPLKALTQLENVNMMWQAADVLARKFAGQPFQASADATPNMWIATKDNIGTYTEPYPLVADYQAQYKKLWGV